MNAVYLLWENYGYDFDPWPRAFASVDAAMAASPGDWSEDDDNADEWSRHESPKVPTYSGRYYKIVRRIVEVSS